MKSCTNCGAEAYRVESRFCNKCGKQLAEGETFCAGCGTAAGGQNPGAQNAPPPGASGGGGGILDTPDTTHEFDPGDIQANKTMAILAYIIFFIPLIAAPNSRYAKYHANQGLILFFVELICMVIPIIGWICSLAAFGLFIIGLMNAANNRAKELPVVGKFRIIKY